MATCKTNCCHSDSQKSHFNNTKVYKKARHVTRNVQLVYMLSFCALFALTYAQLFPQNPYLKDRDPRWYSRPGVDWKPRDPGDKEYR